MKIDTNKIDSKRASKLLSKFLELNENSIEKHDYLENDTLVLGTNPNSGYSYIYLDSTPSTSLCLDPKDELCIIYSSGLDGLEYKRDVDVQSLSDLEDVLYKAYEFDAERDDDYENEELIEVFDKKMLNAGWSKL